MIVVKRVSARCEEWGSGEDETGMVDAEKSREGEDRAYQCTSFVHTIPPNKPETWTGLVVMTV